MGCCLSSSATSPAEEIPDQNTPSSHKLLAFEPDSPLFSKLHTGKSRVFAESSLPQFHEAGVWMPHTNEWLVTSNRLQPDTPKTHVQISAIHHPSGTVRDLPHLAKVISMANGGTTDFAGGAYLCSQGFGEISGSLWHIDATLSSAKRVIQPEDLMLNSVNDVVLHRASQTLLFTDPSYGVEVQHFRTSYNPTRAVWAVRSKGSVNSADWHKLSERADQPNGILLSPDESVCYVTDVWAREWQQNPDVMLKHTADPKRSRVLAYDVEYDVASGDHRKSPTLTNPRVFCDLCTEEGASGYPDGIKCDENRNVYVGCGDGCRIYAPDGNYLGRFRIAGGVTNLVSNAEKGLVGGNRELVSVYS